MGMRHANAIIMDVIIAAALVGFIISIIVWGTSA